MATNTIQSNNIEKNLGCDYPAYSKIYRLDKKQSFLAWFICLILLPLLILFLPWTQSVRAKGSVTSLRQESRPQELNTILAGKIIKWYVKEGDYVKKGDTLIQLGEIKVDYLDTMLLERTNNQVRAKKQSIEGYQGKVGATDRQLSALQEALQLKTKSLDNKIKQQLLKIQSDSNELIAVKNEFSIYKRQFAAGKIMLDSGAIALTEFEKRKANYQNSASKCIATENKFIQDKQELIGLNIEKNSAVQDYIDKASKSEGEKYAALSAIASTESDVSKMENIYASYDARNKLYYITAPQDGQITKMKAAGLGETVKEGETLAEIVPKINDVAIELFIQPMDLQLISIGQNVRFIFDGFPAIIFSGWPNSSYGVFSGSVVAIENSISDNGKFRILVAQDPTAKKWPAQLRLGTGALGIMLLKDVPLYYEIWRNINGFPPDYYSPKNKPSKGYYDAKPEKEKGKEVELKIKVAKKR